jgi:hypothetical protein
LVNLCTIFCLTHSLSSAIMMARLDGSPPFLTFKEPAKPPLRGLLPLYDITESTRRPKTAAVQ